MSKELPETMDELMDYIEEHSARIFVRVQKNGKWENSSLAKLPGDQAIQRAFQFLREGAIPVRVLTDAEVAARKARTAAE